MRHYVLVTAVRAGSATSTASGIRKLKRGTHLRDFIQSYLLDEAKIGDQEHKIYDRDGTSQAVSTIDGVVCSWSFTAYPEGELLSAVSHLTKEELLRDLKELLPLKAELR